MGAEYEPVGVVKQSMVAKITSMSSFPSGINGKGQRADQGGSMQYLQTALRPKASAA